MNRFLEIKNELENEMIDLRLKEIALNNELDALEEKLDTLNKLRLELIAKRNAIEIVPIKSDALKPFNKEISSSIIQTISAIFLILVMIVFSFGFWEPSFLRTISTFLGAVAFAYLADDGLTNLKKSIKNRNEAEKRIEDYIKDLPNLRERKDNLNKLIWNCHDTIMALEDTIKEQKVQLEELYNKIDICAAKLQLVVEAFAEAVKHVVPECLDNEMFNECFESMNIQGQLDDIDEYEMILKLEKDAGEQYEQI